MPSDLKLVLEALEARKQLAGELTQQLRDAWHRLSVQAVGGLPAFLRLAKKNRWRLICAAAGSMDWFDTDCGTCDACLINKAVEESKL
jgi:hypothetical protein